MPVSALLIWRVVSDRRKLGKFGSCVVNIQQREAEEMGMVNKVVPFERLEDETVDWCKTILKR